MLLRKEILYLMMGHYDAQAHIDANKSQNSLRYSDNYKNLSVVLSIKGCKSGLKSIGFKLPSASTDTRTFEKLDNTLFDGAGVFMCEGYSERNILRVVAILKQRIAEMDEDARAKLPRFIPVILAFDETKVVLNATYDTRTDALVGVKPKAHLYE